MVPILKREYTTREVCRYARITRRQLQWWIEHRLLRVRMAGRTRRFDEEQRERARIIATLRRAGVPFCVIVRSKLKVGYLFYTCNRKSMLMTSEAVEIIDWQLRNRGPHWLVSVMPEEE